MTTQAFIDFLDRNDIQVEKSDLYDMVKKEPLSNIVQNVNGNEVIFKGQTSDNEVNSPDENKKTREKMAKSQLK